MIDGRVKVTGKPSKYFSLTYYLRGKPFLLETDHRNLLWIEKSDVPIVVRWRVFLQSFVMFIRHVSGAKNTVADWLSRMHAYLASERVTQLSELFDGMYA